MNLEIKGVDDTKPVGNLVLKYGESKYNSGYNAGYIAGIVTGIVLSVSVYVGVNLIHIRRMLK